MGDISCDIEILRSGGEYEARIEGVMPNIISLKSDNLEELLEQLEQFGLVSPRPGTGHYDTDALVVARTARELADFGIEPRHLRAFKAAADREVGLVQQVVAPLERGRDAAASARAKANSCRCPAEKETPRSATWCPRPADRVPIKRSAFTSCAACSTL